MSSKLIGIRIKSSKSSKPSLMPRCRVTPRSTLSYKKSWANRFSSSLRSKRSRVLTGLPQGNFNHSLLFNSLGQSLLELIQISTSLCMSALRCSKMKWGRRLSEWWQSNKARSRRLRSKAIQSRLTWSRRSGRISRTCSTTCACRWSKLNSHF